jgi:coenzyme PQQ precursor peptide PqqA
MPWTKPDFVEISLAMEVTAYVNTDGPVASRPVAVVSQETPVSSVTTDS